MHPAEEQNIEGGDKLETRKAKTHKGRRYLDLFKPKLNEDPRKCLILKGNKTSEWVTKTMDYFYSIRKPMNIKFQRKNEIRPFEDVSSLEFLSHKNLCPMFIFGKKKPNSLTIGRVFHQKLLDMVEFEVTQFEEINEGKGWNKILLENYPAIAFQGAGFEFDSDTKRIRNLLHDLFNRGSEIQEGDLLGLTRLFVSVVLDAAGNYHFRFFLSNIISHMVHKSTWTSDERTLTEIGPRLTLKVRRKNLAADDLYKQAIKRKNKQTQRIKKNIELTAMGDKIGRVHIQQPDLNTIEIRKYNRFINKGLHQIQKDKALEKRELQEDGSHPADDGNAGAPAHPADAQGSNGVVRPQKPAKKLKRE